MLKPKVATAWTPPDGECDAVETLGALKQTGGRVHVRPRDESRALSPDAAEKAGMAKVGAGGEDCPAAVALCHRAACQEPADERDGSRRAQEPPYGTPTTCHVGASDRQSPE